MAPSLTYHPVKGSGASLAGAGCGFVRSAARTAPKEDAKTAQVETQALNRLVGLLEAAKTAFPIRTGMGAAPLELESANRRSAESRK
jgi:hypothetical protein